MESTEKDGYFWPVGCHEAAARRLPYSGARQQPAEVCNAQLACLKAFSLTGEAFFYDSAQRCQGWFLGENSAGVPMVGESSGGCYDALEEDGPDGNQGAESLLSWCVSHASLALSDTEERKT